MTTATERKYAGRWYTRRVPLDSGEKVILSTSALEVGIQWLGSSQPGLLFLTDRRLIFTPMGWPAPRTRKVYREQVSNVEVSEVRWFGIDQPYCVLRIDSGGQKRRFAFFGRLESQRKRAHEWLEAIHQWKN